MGFSTNVENINSNERLTGIDFQIYNNFQHLLKQVKTMKDETLLSKAEDAIKSSFEEISFLEKFELQLEPNRNNVRPDIHLTFGITGAMYSIIAEVKNNGEPRYARQAVNQILLYLQENPVDYGIFVAPYISPRAAAICKESGIGSLDLAGNCYLSFKTIYIHKTGKPNPFKRKKYLRSLFTPKAERILRVLLNSGPRQWKFKELANEANVSLGQVSNVKNLLEDQEWLASGFSVKDPEALLGEWANNYQYRRNQVNNYYSLLSASEFEAEIDIYCRKYNIQYGLTGFSASARMAPAVRYQRATAYVEADIDQTAEDLKLKPVSSGANVLLLKPYDDGVFYRSREFDGSRAVSPIQVYLDLMNFRGRGEEAANALFDKVIRKLW